MSTKFKPRLDVLPLAQQRLLPRLHPTSRLGMVLYGGTAIALRLGHRVSLDFDFFTDAPLDKKLIHASFPFAAQSTVLQEAADTYTLLVNEEAGEGPSVKVSFFGRIDFGRVGEPDVTEDGVLQIASLGDLMATKLKVLLQRVEAKDYEDLAALLRAGVDLAQGLAAARIMHGPSFQPTR